MSNDDIKFHIDAINGCMRGVLQLERAVKSTLGPRGRVVFLQDDKGGLIATKDGVTVARHVCVEDELADAGISIIRMASSETVKRAGDGTSSAVVVAAALLRGAIKVLASGVHPEDLNRGMRACLPVLLSSVRSMAKPITGVDEIRAVATISANNDRDLGGLVCRAIELQLSGKIGGISVVESKDADDGLDIVDGAKVDAGFFSSGFINQTESKRVVLAGGVYVLLINSKLDRLPLIVSALDKVVKEGKGLIIVADDFSEEVISALLLNKTRAGLNVCAIKSPGFGDDVRDTLEDIAIITGGKVVSPSMGDDTGDIIERLGLVDEITVTDQETTFVGGKGDGAAILDRGEVLKYRCDKAEGHERHRLEKRIAMICGGIGVIRVGATTEAVMHEKKDRLDDALHAAKAAVLSGGLPGGGIALFHAAKALNINMLPDRERPVVPILKDACRSVFMAIVENCGIPSGIAIDKIENNNSCTYGYHGIDNEFKELLEAGVIDPLQVIESVLESAISASMAIISLGASVVRIKQESATMPSGLGI